MERITDTDMIDFIEAGLRTWRKNNNVPGMRVSSSRNAVLRPSDGGSKTVRGALRQAIRDARKKAL